MRRLLPDMHSEKLSIRVTTPVGQRDTQRDMRLTRRGSRAKLTDEGEVRNKNSGEDPSARGSGTMVTGANIGCGTSVCELSGWENIDNSPTAKLSKHPLVKRLLVASGVLPASVASVPWPRSVRVHDAAKGLPYSDSSLLHVYTSHFLEHLPPKVARYLLLECHRVLVVGGILRVVVPDLLALCQEYLAAAAGDDKGARLAADQLIVRTALRSVDAGGSGWLNLLRRVWGRDGHYWMYDEHSLSARLEEAGFRNVTRRRFGESAIPHVECLDVPARAAESLYVEGQKSGPAPTS
jgi:predicted SAM-dependent methyltransferase